MTVKNLSDLFQHTLKDVYFAENFIRKNLPKMIEKSTNPSLKKLFKDLTRRAETHL